MMIKILKKIYKIVVLVFIKNIQDMVNKFKVVMIVIRVSLNSVLVSDSFTDTIKRYDRNQFDKIYNLFGQRALYYPN